MFGIDLKGLWPIYAAIAAMIIIFSTYAYIKHLRFTISEKTLENQQCVFKVESQNAATDQLHRESESYKRKLKESQHQNELVLKDYDEKLKAVEKDYVSPDCISALQYARDKAKQL